MNAARLARFDRLFEEINIWEDPDAAAFVRSVANGNETVPTVAVGDVRMLNPSARHVRAVAAQSSSLPRPERRRWLHRRQRTGATA